MQKKQKKSTRRSFIKLEKSHLAQKPQDKIFFEKIWLYYYLS